MQPSEDDGDRKEHDVARVSTEKSHEFNHLCESEYKSEQGPERILAIHQIPFSSRIPKGVQYEWIGYESQRGEGGQVQSVCAPDLLSILKSSSQHTFEFEHWPIGLHNVRLVTCAVFRCRCAEKAVCLKEVI